MKTDDFLDKLDHRLDLVQADLTDVRLVQSAQHATLAEHIRRTELLEAELTPIKTHVAFVGALAKVAGAAGAVFGALLALKQLLGW